MQEVVNKRGGQSRVRQKDGKLSLTEALGLSVSHRPLRLLFYSIFEIAIPNFCTLCHNNVVRLFDIWGFVI